MRKYVFPYGFRLSLKEKKIISFPAIAVSLIKKDSQEEFSFLVLIDSGAEVSLFTKSDSQLLGIALDKGEKIEIGSASGDKFSAFLHPVILKIEDERFKIKVAFSEKDNVPRILGRNPTFSYFFMLSLWVFISQKDKINKNFLFRYRK